MPALDRLDAMLTRLQLFGVRAQLDSLLDEAARAELSACETLALLCEREIARKDHRRIEMALKLAHFPVARDLSGFDFEAQPSADPKQIRDLAAGRCSRRERAALGLARRPFPRGQTRRADPTKPLVSADGGRFVRPHPR